MTARVIMISRASIYVCCAGSRALSAPAADLLRGSIWLRTSDEPAMHEGESSLIFVDGGAEFLVE